MLTNKVTKVVTPAGSPMRPSTPSTSNSQGIEGATGTGGTIEATVTPAGSPMRPSTPSTSNSQGIEEAIGTGGTIEATVTPAGSPMRPSTPSMPTSQGITPIPSTGSAIEGAEVGNPAGSPMRPSTPSMSNSQGIEGATGTGDYEGKELSRGIGSNKDEQVVKLNFNNGEESESDEPFQGDSQKGFMKQICSYIPTKEGIIEKLSRPEVQFTTGMVTSKLLVGPTLNYVSDKMNGEKADKSIVSYYQESLQQSTTVAIKGGLFYFVSILPLPMKFSASSTISFAKVASDALYNSGLAIKHKTFDPLYKMASFDYGKELSLWFVMGSTTKILSMTGANNLVVFNEMYKAFPMAMGAVLGASSEIVHFAETSYSKLHSLIAGETSNHIDEA